MPDQNEQLQEMHQRGETGPPDRRSPGEGPARHGDIAVGADVYTHDGEKIGVIKEIAGGYFKVNAHMQPDYWLQREFVEPGGDRITMEFKKDDLHDYKVKDLPEGAVAQGQDGITGGALANPEGGYPENPAAATLRAAEGRND